MVKHIILWKINENLSLEEKSAVCINAKRELEGLVGKIPGLVKMNVVITALESSNADMMLDSIFESEAALNVYRDHPDHVRVADSFVRPYTVTRLCLDHIV